MESYSFWLTLANTVILLGVFLLLKNYIASYFREKGKNLATKEDIEEITRRVEGVKTQYSTEIERLRLALQQKGRLLDEKRRIYGRIADSLRIFIAGQTVDDKRKDQFLASYAGAWLWASDGVLEALHRFLNLQMRNTNQAGSVGQDDMKAAYADVLLEMRKDVGFVNTKVQSESHRFVRF